MLIQTKFLGEVEIQESEVIMFKGGLPGFSEYEKYILLGLDADLPLALLQSTEEASISFVVAYPYAFKPNYAFDLSEEDKEELQVEKEEEVVAYSIITLQDTFADSTLNLLAPVVINIEKKIGKQIVLHDSQAYPLRFSIKEMEGVQQ